MFKIFLPKKHLEWKEPKEVCQAREKKENWKSFFLFRPFLAFLVGVPLLLPWWLGTQNSSGTTVPFSEAILFAFLFGCFIVYLVPWLYSLCPSVVRILDNGISKTVGDNVILWKFKDIAHCDLISARTGESLQYLFEIHLNSGKRILLGIPKEQIPELVLVLSRLNVRFDQNLQPPEGAQ